MIVLDTATWIWLTSEPSRLSSAAADTIKAHGEATVSSISAWEVGMLVAKGRITIDRPVDIWVDQALRANGLLASAVDHSIAVLATMLPADVPADPADRMIVATTLRLGGLLITPDQRLLEYPFCPTIW